MAQLDFSSFLPLSCPPAELMGKISEATIRGDIINFGLIMPDMMTTEQKKIDSEIVASMPRFGIRGRFTMAERRYPLWKAGVLLFGRFLKYNWQQTGSCVGAGWGNMAKTSAAVEIKIRGEWEEYRELWWPYTYGRGRLAGGMRGRGEGSFGSAQAEAALKDGCFEIDPAGFPDLPDFQERDNWLIQPSSVEMEWSAGDRVAEQWITLGRKKLFKTAAKAKSADDVIEGLINGYPCTQASNFGFSNPRVKGTKQPVRIAEWNGSWAHQTWIDEYWDHPEVGEIVRWGNNWGPGAHGAPTGDEPPGGVYITKATLDQIVKRGEVFIFSGDAGFPARELNFSAF